MNFSFKPICFLVPHASQTSTRGGHVTNLTVLKINMIQYLKSDVNTEILLHKKINTKSTNVTHHWVPCQANCSNNDGKTWKKATKTTVQLTYHVAFISPRSGGVRKPFSTYFVLDSQWKYNRGFIYIRL